ncbi:MAG TPA: XdhC family protein [Bacillus bacterium]|nr:XdhC family protein [Bacillus sp. (in: firmicutes)]
MQSMLKILEAVQKAANRSVLATIIQIEGSAYLKEGATMLIEENGHTVGMISPGCLEEDLILRCKDIFISQRPQTIVYDLRSIDDLGWGQGMGCNGVLRVLVEPVTKNLKNDLLSVKNSLENGHAVLHKKIFAVDYTLKNYSFEIVQEYEHENGDSQIYNFQHMYEGYTYSFLYTPAPALIIFGAGEDAKPLVSLASRIGFIVKLCDWRPSLCNELHFPTANQYIIGSPQEIVCSIDISEKDFVAIMSHSFSKDQEFLTNLRDYDVRYIGILGSRERTSRLLGMEREQKNIYSPIGLSVGAQGPEEIAVSIMAEILQQYRQSNGRCNDG